MHHKRLNTSNFAKASPTLSLGALDLCQLQHLKTTMFSRTMSHTYIHLYIHVHVYVHVCIDVYMYVCAFMTKYVCVTVFMAMCTCVFYVHVCVHVFYLYVCTYMYMCVCAHVCELVLSMATPHHIKKSPVILHFTIPTASFQARYV